MKIPIQEQLQDIRATRDLFDKALKLAGLVSRVFRETGWELIVVDGSAVECYTEGSYMSGDIDFCRKSLLPIPLRLAQDLMGQLGATGGPRSWAAVEKIGPSVVRRSERSSDPRLRPAFRESRGPDFNKKGL